MSKFVLPIFCLRTSPDKESRPYCRLFIFAESLKTAVDTLSPKERHELSCYLTKLDLQNDADYRKTIRERTNSGHARRYVPVTENQDKP